MSDEFKFWAFASAVVLSISFFIVTLSNSREVSNEHYEYVATQKKIWDSEADDKGWDIYREWLKDATADDKISYKEFKNLEDISENNEKLNMIRELKK